MGPSAVADGEQAEIEDAVNCSGLASMGPSAVADGEATSGSVFLRTTRSFNGAVGGSRRRADQFLEVRSLSTFASMGPSAVADGERQLRSHVVVVELLQLQWGRRR